MKKQSTFFFLVFLILLNTSIPYFIVYNKDYEWIPFIIGTEDDILLIATTVLNSYIIFHLIRLKPKRKKKKSRNEY